MYRLWQDQALSLVLWRHYALTCWGWPNDTLTYEWCSVPAYGVYGSTCRSTSYPALLWVGMTSGAVTLKSKAYTFTSFLSDIFISWYYRRELRAHSPRGIPFVIFAWERRWQKASHKICWHLVAMVTRSTRRPVDTVSRHWTPLRFNPIFLEFMILWYWREMYNC